MFSQRKSFWKRRWFLIAVVVILGAGYWFSQGDRFPSDVDTPLGEEVDQRVEAQPGTSHTGTAQVGEDIAITTPDTTEPVEENFFLVKEIDGVIEVYYYDGEGEPTFVKSTDIAFSLLSEVDQTMFSEGVLIKTEEELHELLQDFGS